MSIVGRLRLMNTDGDLASFSHLTDFLRYSFLWKYGGTCWSLLVRVRRTWLTQREDLDMDAPWVRSPPDSELQFIGEDQSTVASDAEWTLDETGRYLAPGVMRFKKGWRVFRDILEDAFSVHYSPACFNCVGPRAITKGVKKDLYELERNGFTIVNRKRLYPRGWQTSSELVVPMRTSEEAKEALRAMIETSWSIHLFGKMTNHLRIENDSVIKAAFDSFNLRVARRRGPLTSRHASPVDESDPLVYPLASGLELVAPSVYRFKSLRRDRSSLEVAAVDPVADRQPSLDGAFDGLDVIRIRAVRHAGGPVSNASIRVSTRKGSIGWGTSTTIRTLASFDKVAHSNEAHFEFKDATLRDVNVALASLRYVPAAIRPSRSSETDKDDEDDEMTIRVTFGDEEPVEQKIRIIQDSA